MKKPTQTSYLAYNEGLQIIYEETLATEHKIWPNIITPQCYILDWIRLPDYLINHIS